MRHGFGAYCRDDYGRFVGWWFIHHTFRLVG